MSAETADLTAKNNNKKTINKVLFFTGLTYFIIFLLFVGLRILFSLGAFGDSNPIWRDRFFTLFAQILIMGIVPVVLIFFLCKDGVKPTLSRFSIRKFSWNTLFYTLLLGVLTFFLTIIISTFFNGILGFFGYQPGSASPAPIESPWVYFLLSVLFTAVLPGIFEEVTHRGLLLGGLRNGSSTMRAIVLSGLLFGLMHLNITQFFYAAIIGMLLGALTVLTRSIFPAMIVHFTNNFLSTYISHAEANNWFGGNFYDAINGFFAANNPIYVFLCAFIIIAFVIFGITSIFMRLFINRKREEFKEFVERFKKEMEKSGHADSIDFTNQTLMFEYYRNAEAVKMHTQAMAHNLTDEEYAAAVTPKNIWQLIAPKRLPSAPKPAFFENFFFYASLTLGIIITIITFIWGVL